MKDPMAYFSVNDFSWIRFECCHPDCGFVFEVTLEKVAETMKAKNGCCPMCGKPFANPNVHHGTDAITPFAESILAIGKLSEQVKLFLPLSKERLKPWIGE